jgi:GntR family transcriptional repressor for pyruvate dehydrogenase complex
VASAVSDKAISAIKQMVVDGRLKPGDRLPTEKELAETIGVSRNSLREAVKALSVIRVLDVRQGDGTYVTALEPEQLLESLSFVLDLHQDSSHLEILELRRLMEPIAVEQATPHLTDEDFAQLDEMLAQLNADSGIEALVASDIAFHRLINHRCPNAYLSTLLDSLASSTSRARVWRGLTDSEAVERTLSEHSRILEALREGRADLARAYATSHVAGVESWLIRQGMPEEDAGEAGNDGAGSTGPAVPTQADNPTTQH